MGRLLPFILLILGLLGAFFGWPYYLESSGYRDQVASELSRVVGVPVTIEKIDVQFFSPAVTLEKVAFQAPDKSEFFTTSKLVASVSLLQLFQKEFKPTRLVCDGWKWHVARLPDASWVWFPKEVTLASVGSRVPWMFDQVEWENGEIVFQDALNRSGETEMRVEKIEGAWKIAENKFSTEGRWRVGDSSLKANVQLNGSFLQKQDWTGTLTLSDASDQCVVSLRHQGKEWNVSGTSEKWSWDSLYAFLRFYLRWDTPAPKNTRTLFLEKWKFQSSWGAMPFTFSHQSKLSGGTSSFQGVFSTGTLSTARVNWSLQQVQIAPVVTALWDTPNGESPFEGLLSAKGQFDVPLSSKPWTAFHGQAKGDVLKGFYPWPATISKGLQKAHLRKYIDTKYPELMTKGPRFQKMSFTIRAENGFLHADELFVDLGDVQTSVAGIYDIERRGIDAYVRLKVWEDDAQLLKLLPRNYVVRSRRKLNVIPFNGRWVGTWGQLKLVFVKQRAVPSAMLQKLISALRA